MPKKELRPAPTALETAQKELRALKGIRTVFRMMTENLVPFMEPIVYDQIRKMVKTGEDLRKLIEGSKARSDKEIKSELAEIHARIRRQFDDNTRLKMDAFFETMEPEIAKTEEWKQMYQVYLKFSAVESPEVTRWNREKLKIDERFNKLTEKVPREELMVINRNIHISRKRIADLTRKLETENTPEKIAVQEQLEKEKQKYNNLMECWPELNDISKDAQNLIKAKPNGVILDDVMKTAVHLYDQTGIHQEGHTNSKEFDEMITALDLVAYWDSPDTLKSLMLAGDTYRSMDTMLKLLKLTAQTYLDEKHLQFRPFPTARRQARLALAESLIEFVDEQLEKMDVRSKDAVDIEAYNMLINEQEVDAPKTAEQKIDIDLDDYDFDKVFSPNINDTSFDESFMHEKGDGDKLNISLMNVPDF